ncbi:dystonin [Caerostris extrusa]|uniref:Dystonin n=1 Tax=Caerostris extrusa TaxID=172846 RepID=A0AAV4XVD1_CAEEX|nr:dystonin [Caerostris extrusa]
MDSHEMHHEIESSMSTYHTLSQKKAAIEDVNVDGGRYIREAKMYDLQLKYYQDGLDDNPAASEAKRAKIVSGTEIVSQELDQLNQQYTDLVNALLQRVNELKSLVSSQEGQKFSVTIIQAAPIVLKTYRTELIWEQVPFSLNHTSNYSNHYTPTHSMPKPNVPYEQTFQTAFSTRPSLQSTSVTTFSKKAPLKDETSSTVIDKWEFLQSKNNADISAEEAVELGIVRKESIICLIKKNIIRCIQYTIPEAVIKGHLDPDSGVFTSPQSKTALSIPDAHLLGYLCNASPIIEDSYSLVEALDSELFTEDGRKVIDPDSGKWHSISDALNHGILSKRLREVVDPSIGNVISLPEAIDYKLIDASSGSYVHPTSGKELSLKEAYQRSLIMPSLTLKHAFEKSLIEDDGKVVNVLNSSKDKILTLAEALTSGVITSDCKFVDYSSGEKLSITQAANRGYLASVDRRMIFDIEGFRDTKTNEYVSFNAAVERSIVDKESCLVCDLNTGFSVNMREGIERKLVIPQVYEMLNKSIGIFGEVDKELTLLECVMTNRVDPQTGYLLEPATKRPIRLMEAVERNIITEDGAVTLKSLLNITVTLTSITKTTTRYVTIANQSLGSDLRMSFEEAYKQGLIDESRRTFRDSCTGNVMPIEEAIARGYLSILPFSTSEAHIKQSEVTMFKNNLQFNRSCVMVDVHENSQAMDIDEEIYDSYKNIQNVKSNENEKKVPRGAVLTVELCHPNASDKSAPKGLFL